MSLTNTDDRPDKGRYRGLRRDSLALFAFAPPFERTRAVRSVPCPRFPRNPFFRRARKCGPSFAAFVKWVMKTQTKDVELARGGK